MTTNGPDKSKVISISGRPFGEHDTEQKREGKLERALRDEPVFAFVSANGDRIMAVIEREPTGHICETCGFEEFTYDLVYPVSVVKLLGEKGSAYRLLPYTFPGADRVTFHHDSMATEPVTVTGDMLDAYFDCLEKHYQIRTRRSG